MGEPLLRVRGLGVGYVTARGVLRAVSDVSFDLGPGEILGLVGESGCGKSTVLHGVMRTLDPPALITGGEAWLGDKDLLALDAAALRAVRWRDVAVVFQSAMNALNPVLTVGEQIADTLRAHGRRSGPEIAARVESLLDMVGIDRHHARSYPHELSGGMRQRVVIAIALALGPRVLLMDEPTTALDVVVEREILARLVALQRRLGFGVLLVTHDLSLLLQIADRIGVMYAGRLVEIGPVEAIREGGLHPYTQGLLASMPVAIGEVHDPRGIPGSMPSLEEPVPGCAFHPRCPRAVDACRAAVPPRVEVRPGHEVACIRVTP